MRHKAEKMGRNRGQGIIIGFLVFVIAVISICTIIFRSYVREFHKVTEKEKYDQYYVMITEDRKPDFWQSVYRGAYERGQAENVYVDLLGGALVSGIFQIRPYADRHDIRCGRYSGGIR